MAEEVAAVGGELRHVGATIELITQAEGKLAKEFKEEAERQVIVSSSDTRREPIFGIEMGDIYQLLAKAFPEAGLPRLDVGL